LPKPILWPASLPHRLWSRRLLQTILWLPRAPQTWSEAPTNNGAKPPQTLCGARPQ
jgi:hypothetical protein